MQATLDAQSLKPFTKALTCISRFGDEMILHASHNKLVLTSMNQARTAFCSITYEKAFFSKLRIADAGDAGTSRTASGRSRDGRESMPTMLRCQLQTKALLNILKHKNTEKSTEKCKLTIIDRNGTPEEELRDTEDSFESRLIVKLYCRHNIVKTHRLLLNDPTHDSAPLIPENENESKLVVQGRAAKQIIDLFKTFRGAKGDPELVWRFADREVKIMNVEKGGDGTGKSQLTTELRLDADEFDSYKITDPPVTFGIFQREFNAAVALADSLVVPMDFRFTQAAEPVYISFKTENSFMLFVLATHPARISSSDERGPTVRPQTRPQNGNTSQQLGRRLALNVSQAKKRGAPDDEFEDDDSNGVEGRASTSELEVNRPKSGGARPNRIESSRSPTEMPYATASSRAAPAFGGNGFEHAFADEMLPPPTQSQPLFIASQVSQRDLDIIRESGLGIEDMDAQQFAEMLDGGVDLEETLPQAESTTVMKKVDEDVAPDDDYDLCGVASDDGFDLCEDDSDMGPTQRGAVSQRHRNKSFEPIFED